MQDDSNADTGHGGPREPDSGGDGPAGGRSGPGLPAVLGALVALAAALRFHRLGLYGLWIDEAHTLNDALATTRASFNYPLNYWATQLVIALTGRTDEAALRLFPALCGALSLPLAAWAFRPWLGSRRALAAGALLGLSSWHLYWSQSARAYTLALLLTLLGTGWLVRGIQRRSRSTLAKGLGAGLLACLAHPSAALLLPAWIALPPVLARLGVLTFRLRLPRWARLAAPLVGAVLAVWGGVVLYDYWDAHGTELDPGAWVASWKHLVLSTGYYVTPWLGAGAALGALRAWRGRPRPLGDLAASFVVVAVLASALAAAMLVRVSAQYVFVLLPWIAALATWPLAGRGRPSPLAKLYLVGLLALGAVDLALYFGPRFGNRPRWREAYAHVLEQRGGDDLVFGMAAVVGQYYLDPGSADLRSHRDLVRLNSYTAEEPGRWARRGRRTWFVVRREDLMDWPAEDRASFRRMLAEECRLTLELPVGWTPRDLTVRVYVREAFGRMEGEETGDGG